MDEEHKEMDAIERQIMDIRLKIVGYPSRQESYGDGSEWTDIVEVPVKDMEIIYSMICRLEAELFGVPA